MRNFSVNNTIWKNKGHEFDEVANALFPVKRKIYLWGGRNNNCIFWERTGKFIKEQIVAVIDDTSEAPYMELAANEKYPVSTKEDVAADKECIIICTYYDRIKYEEARAYCRENGFLENVNFWQGEVFSMLYDVYVRNQIWLDRIEVFLTSCCTLKCEKCISYIPYFKHAYYTPVEKLKEDADLFFAKVDYVGKWKVLGGEGLLYPQLIEYIDYLYSHYGEKIGSIRIGTNGTIIPKPEILEMCKRNNVTMDISDYTAAVPECCKLDEVKAACLDAGVRVDIKRVGEQWLDMGFPGNSSVPEKTEAELKTHFEKCAMFCRQYGGGKLYFCCSNYAAVKAGLFPDNENDYFDFHKDFTKKELLEYEIGFSALGHTTFCNVCNGCSEEANPNHIEVAKQIKESSLGNLVKK